MFGQYCAYPFLGVHLLIVFTPHEVLFHCKKKPSRGASVIFKWLSLQVA